MPLLEVIFHAILDKYRYDVELEEEALVATYSLDLDATQAPKEVVERKKRNIKWMQKTGAIGYATRLELVCMSRSGNPEWNVLCFLSVEFINIPYISILKNIL